MEVWAYGSRVNGNAHDGSDLDLVAFSNNGIPFPPETMATIKRNIQESNIPILVQLFDWHQLSEQFRKTIEAEHEVFFSNMIPMAGEPKPTYTKK